LQAGLLRRFPCPPERDLAGLDGLPRLGSASRWTIRMAVVGLGSDLSEGDVKSSAPVGERSLRLGAIVGHAQRA